jgi:hypothetical protein
MKKKLNMEGITNELRGGSAFFPDYGKSEPSPLSGAAEGAQQEQVSDPVLPVREVHPVLPVRPVLPQPRKRIMKQRWPSDIWQDQYESLQEFSLEDRKQGLSGSMSAMVREALDDFVAKRRGK